jgi:outer membrane protein TolC
LILLLSSGRKHTCISGSLPQVSGGPRTAGGVLLTSLFFCSGWAIAQSASQMPVAPTRALQLPLSGRPMQAGQPSVMQQTAPGGGNSGSVDVIDSTVMVPAPYNGSVPKGTATANAVQLTLAQALAMGLRTNLGVLAQSANEQQARGQKVLAKSELLPQLNTVVSEAFEKENLRTLGVSLPSIPTTSKFNYYDARAARLNQTVFDFVKIRNLQGAEQNVQANIQASRNTRDLIVLAVAGSYIQLGAGKARADAAQAEVEEFHAIYQRAADRLEAGLATRVDATRAKVQLQTQQQRLRSLQADVATQRLKLARLIGLPLGQSFVASDNFQFIALSGLTEADALSRAQAGRQDLKAAASAVKAAELAVKAAHAERLPTVAVNADFGAAGVTPTNHSDGVYSVSGTLTIPLYQGGRIHGDVEVASAALRQRQAEQADLVGQVDQDVRQAFIDLNAAADQVTVAESNRVLAHESLDQSTDRFVAGVADTVEVVQAEQAVVQADDDLILAVFEHNLGKVSLARAMGDAEQSLPQMLRN